MLSIYWFYMLLFTSCNIYDMLGIPQNKKSIYYFGNSQGNA